MTGSAIKSVAFLLAESIARDEREGRQPSHLFEGIGVPVVIAEDERGDIHIVSFKDEKR